MFGRNKVAALVAEFLGTGLLTLLTLSALRSQPVLGFFIAIALGLSLTVLTFVFARASGGYFNPAITLGLWTARKVSTPTALLYIVMQFVGAFAALHFFEYLVKAPVNDLASGIKFSWQLLLVQITAAAIFSMAYAAALFERYTAAATAAIVGLGYATGIYFALNNSFGLLNPALALGVRSFDWATYVLGPVVGALIGVNLYKYLFANVVLNNELEAEVALTGAAKPLSTAAASTTSATTTRRTTAKRGRPATKRAASTTTRTRTTTTRAKRRTTRK